MEPRVSVGTRRWGSCRPHAGSVAGGVGPALCVPVRERVTLTIVCMSHPIDDPTADLPPIQVGEIWENPVSGERARLLEPPWHNSEGRLVAELAALVGARVAGEHRHPNTVERFTAVDGELTVRLNGETSILREGQTREVEPGRWHDWWNASDAEALVRVEVTPGERFMHMIETLWGLARLGHTNQKGMPDLLQLAMFGREFSDVIQFRNPPPLVQKAMFGVLGVVGRPLGYRGTYRQLSRTASAVRPVGQQS